MGNIRSCFSPSIQEAVVITADGVHHIAQLPMDQAEASELFAPGERFLGNVDGIVASGFTPAPLWGSQQLEPGGVYVFIPQERMEEFFSPQEFPQRRKLREDQINRLRIILERVKRTRSKRVRVGCDSAANAEVIWG